MKPELERYSSIIWDWNGTLLNDAWLCVEVMNGMLEERGLRKITLNIYRTIFDFPVRDYYLKLGFDFESEPFEKVGMDFMIRYNERQNECNLHPDATGILSRIAEKGHKQYIMSAREEAELRVEVIKSGISGYFDLVYGLDDHYAHGKTDVGLRLLRDMGIGRETLLFIGDTLHDADVAKELGLDCILVADGHHSRERLEGSGRTVLGSLEELNRIL
jgi:phosphoglycolate phosphatase